MNEEALTHWGLLPQINKIFAARVARVLQVRYFAIVITNSSSTAKKGDAVMSDGRTSIKILVKMGRLV